MYLILIVILLVFSLLSIVILRVAVWNQKEKSQNKVKVKTIDLNTVMTNPNQVLSDTKQSIADTFAKECPSENKPPCKPGFIGRTNEDGAMCCYIDPKSLSLSKKELIESMAKDVATELVISIVADKVLSAVGKKIAKSYVGKMTAKLATKISAKISVAMIKLAPKLTAKLALVSAKLAAASAKLGMGPVGWALLAFEVISLGLDAWDPAGYNNWVSNTMYENLRNQAEMSYADEFKNNGGKYPTLVSYMYDKDQIKPIMEMVMTVDEVLDSVSEKSLDRFFEIYGAPDQPGYIEPSDEQFDDILDGVIDEVLVLFDQGQFDKSVCETLQKNNYPVKWVEEAGCSLNEKGCSDFNKYNAALPDDTRQFAMYTNEYRVRNASSPGDNKKPNMVTRKYSDKVCMYSPLEQNYRTCNPKKGSQWIADAGMCSFGAQHCKDYALERSKMGDSRVYNCKMYPGQKVAEIILGTTITRSFIQGAYAAEDAAELLYAATSKIATKTYQAFDDVSDILMNDVLKKAIKIAEKVGREGANMVLKMGRDLVDITYNIVLSPLKIAGELILDAIKLGAKVVFGMSKTIAKGIFKHTKEFIRGIENMGGDIFDGFEDIGKKIGGLFR